MNDIKTAVIIQARMGSTRLPGKVMKYLKNRPVLWHVIERVKQAGMIDQIIVATTTQEKDKIIKEKCQEWGINIYCGSEDDVLARYYETAIKYSVDIVVRITADCPLIDPYVIDELVKFYYKSNYSLVTNAGVDLKNRTYPRGLDTEVFSFKILKKAYQNAYERYQREHVTPYIYENFNNVFYYKNSKDYSKFRLTLDTKEDYELINLIYKKMYSSKHNFYLKEIIELFNNNSELLNINNGIKQKEIK